jgi:hypothetical protein
MFEAMRPGRTELVVRTPTSERRVTIEVAGPAQPPMMAVHHSTVREIVAKDLLFVGHANLDGFDPTAIAKPGIDRLVQEAKKSGWPVVYFVSEGPSRFQTGSNEPSTHGLPLPGLRAEEYFGAFVESEQPGATA